ncbi:MAG TPA: ABC transporter permease [Noviherbaspirillum sp.]|jgi:ABC-type transport system involved in multi-copper enzyme maturation permease subunit|uniref:ABC transporter permease n=1 Tax=Noviherbaspirillum sp. TaxID=1926288 RepID=UPI002F91C273
MFTPIRLIARYTLLEALRNRMAWLFVAIAVVAVGLGGFLNALALTESRQIQLAVLAAFTRAAAVFALAAFIVTSMAREFNDKGLELFLALPLPRASYYLGKLSGFCLLAAIPAVLYGALAALLATPLQAVLWASALLCELWLVAAFCLLCVLSFTHVMGALAAVMGFYLLGRSIGALQLIAQASGEEGGWSQQVFRLVFDVLGAILPRLDRFTPTDWLVQSSGDWSALGALLLQGGAFLVLAVGAGLFDLYRRNI